MPGETRVIDKSARAARLQTSKWLPFGGLVGYLQTFKTILLLPSQLKAPGFFYSLHRKSGQRFSDKCKDQKRKRTPKPKFSGVLGIALFFLLPSNALAQSSTTPFLPGIDATSALPLGIFVGAITFAFLAAFWLIRERAKTEEENVILRSSFADIRADRDRLVALTNIADQRIVIWESNAETVRVLGSFTLSSGVPQSNEEFLQFENWLEEKSTAQLNAAINDLRKTAQQFTIGVYTKNGKTIEARGRVSGDFAFVRFLALEGVQAQMAKLSANYTNLRHRFGVLEALFEKMPSPLWICNREDRLVYVNPAYAHAVDGEDPDIVISENRALLDNKERNTLRDAMDDTKYFHGYLPAVIAGDRKILELTTAGTDHGVAGLAIDRNEVDKIKTTLKHTIASHQQTFDHLAAAIAIFDQKQRLVFHNSSFQRLWELSTGELEGNPSNSDLLEILRSTKRLPETPDWKKWKAGLLACYQATEAKEENWHLPDGRTLRVIITPQNTGGTSWVFENLTEELALRSEYKTLMRVQGETLDHLSEAVAVFGANGKISLTNPAFLTLWNIESPTQIEGQHIRKMDDLTSKFLDDDTVWKNLRLAVTSLHDDRDDLRGRMMLNNGTVLDYHLVYLPAGQSMLTLSDVTAAANVERVLKERNDALEESDSLKNRFLQHVSYELRAPLTGIMGFTEMLACHMPGDLNEKQHEYLDYISESSDVLKAMIDDILDLATIDAGAMKLDYNRVSLARLIERCTLNSAAELQRIAVAVDAKVDPSANEFVADESRIEQILQKLLINAIQSAPDGSTITIEAIQAGKSVEISVENTGETLSKEKRDALFERFKSGRHNDRGQIVGMGLALVKSLVELHGGTVQAEDGKSGGLRLTCRLPLVQPSSHLAAE